MGFQDERLIAAGLSIATVFLYLNVSPEVGTPFAIMTLLYLISLGSSAFQKIEIMRTPTKISEIVGVGLVALSGWVILSSFALQYLAPAFAPQSVFSLDFFQALSAQTQIPILSADPFVRFLTYGVVIPIIETVFFLSFVLVFWAKALRQPLVFSPRQMLLVAVLVGATGSLFHLTVRIAQNYALFADFLFFFISALIVLKYREMSHAMVFHILNNSIVVYTLLVAGR